MAPLREKPAVPKLRVPRGPMGPRGNPPAPYGRAHSRLMRRMSLEKDMPMRTFDLSPLYRSTVGFDRMFNLLDQVTGVEAP